jgi:hypothetical protein
MGKLRIEPKFKPLLSDQEYDFYKDVLAEAHRAAPEHNLYWDLESGEKVRDVRKAFQYVAEKEGIALKIRGQRGSSSLKLSFPEEVKTKPGRMPAAESKESILNAISAAGRPIQKAEIITSAGISPSSWNVRIKELLADGQVIREGSGRQAHYSLP